MTAGVGVVRMDWYPGCLLELCAAGFETDRAARLSTGVWHGMKRSK